jgi:hypothetical protein
MTFVSTTASVARCYFMVASLRANTAIGKPSRYDTTDSCFSLKSTTLLLHSFLFVPAEFIILKEVVISPTQYKGSQPSKPPIQLQEIADVEATVNTLRKTAMQHVQDLLDRLDQRRGENPEANKEIAARIDSLARHIGVYLVSEDKPATFRWNRGVFEARTVGTSIPITFSAAFPSLTTRFRELANDLKPSRAKPSDRSRG